MMKSILLLFACILLVTSCKSFPLLQEKQPTTKQKVSLGTIGLDKDFVLQSRFNNSAIPNYSKPIKVSASIIPFNKSIHKSFLKAEKIVSRDSMSQEFFNVKKLFVFGQQTVKFMCIH